MTQRRWFASLAILLAACGGGGGGGPTDPPAPPPSPPPSGPQTPAPTPLPASLAVAAPVRAEVDAAVGFDATPATTGADLRWSWSFGDGTTSSDARPSHAYAVPGRYDVSVELRNGAGQSVRATQTVTAGRFARLAGRDCSGPDQTGWCWQLPGRAVRAIHSVQFIDALRGIAVGELGQLLSTEDAGRTWTAQAPVPGVRTLQLLRRGGDGVLFAIGQPGNRLYRSEEGRRWEPVGPVPLEVVSNFWVVSRGTLVATRNTDVPTQSTVVSVDGGQTWTPRGFATTEVGRGGLLWGEQGFVPLLSRDLGATTQDLPALVSASRRDDAPLHVLERVAGGGASKGLRHRSSGDRGATWSTPVPVQWPAEVADHEVQRLQLFDGGRGLALLARRTLNGPGTSDWHALSTTDGGRTWAITRRLPGDMTSAALLPDADAVAYSRADTASGAARFSTVLIDLRTGSEAAAAVEPGWGPPASVERQAGGLLVARWDSDIRPPAWSVSADNGRSWTPVPGDNDRLILFNDLNSIGFFDALEGLAMRDDGQLVGTSDGGTTWVHRATGEPDVQYDGGRVHVAPDGTAWLISRGRLLRSDDRGHTWQASPTPDGIVSSVQFVDALHGWLTINRCVLEVGAPPCAFPLYRTTDGGRNWALSPVTIGHRGQVAFADRLRGVATGTGAGQRSVTTDGGLSWTAVAAAGSAETDIAALRFDGHGRGWLLHQFTRTRVLRSTDFGRSWQPVSLPLADDIPGPALNDIHFADADRGWMVGDQGVVLATQDGGRTWVEQASGTTSPLRAVVAVDAGTAWIAGGNSTVLGTATGGR